MKGLLRKDYLSIRMLLWIYLLIALCFWFGYSFFHTALDKAWFVLFYPALLFGLLPLSLMAQDEVDHWEQFAGTLPISRAQLVSSKFYFALLLGLLSTALMLVLFAMGLSTHSSIDWSVFLFSVILHLSYMLLSSGITLLLAFKFGTQKSRFIGLILVGATSGLFFTLGFQISSWGVILLPICALLFALCWYLSIRIYEKRDL